MRKSIHQVAVLFLAVFMALFSLAACGKGKTVRSTFDPAAVKEKLTGVLDNDESTSDVSMSPETEPPTTTKHVDSGKLHKRNFGVVSYGHRIYYIPANEPGIFSMNVDGENRKRIVSRDCDEFDIDKDYIYYRSYDSSAGYSVYRCKLSGNEEELLNNDTALDMIAHGDWLYYINYLDYGDTEYIRFNVNDSGRQVLFPDLAQESAYCYIYDDAIYFQVSGEGIFKIDVNNLENKIRVYSEYNVDFNNLAFTDDWIYFQVYQYGSNDHSVSTIMRSDYDYNHVEPVAYLPKFIMGLQVWEYCFIYQTGGNKIYLQNIDAESGSILAADDESHYINIHDVIGDWVYYDVFHNSDEYGGFSPLVARNAINIHTLELIELD